MPQGNPSCPKLLCFLCWGHLIQLKIPIHLIQKIVWSLGNLAGDGQELRDDVIEQGIIKPLLHLIYTSSIHLILRQCLRNLTCVGRRILSVTAVQQLNPAFQLYHPHSGHCQSDVCQLS